MCHFNVSNFEVIYPLGVDGITTLRSDLAVLKDAGIGGGLEVDGATALHNTAVAGTLEVTGITTLAALSVGVTKLTGELDMTSDLKVNADKFVVTASNGNTAVAGTLDVALATTLAALSADATSLKSTLGVAG